MPHADLTMNNHCMHSLQRQQTHASACAGLQIRPVEATLLSFCWNHVFARDTADTPCLGSLKPVSGSDVGSMAFGLTGNGRVAVLADVGCR